MPANNFGYDQNFTDSYIKKVQFNFSKFTFYISELWPFHFRNNTGTTRQFLERFNARIASNSKKDNSGVTWQLLSQTYNETNGSDTGLDISTARHFYSQPGNVLTNISLNTLDEGILYNDKYFEYYRYFGYFKI